MWWKTNCSRMCPRVSIALHHRLIKSSSKESWRWSNEFTNCVIQSVWESHCMCSWLSCSKWQWWRLRTTRWRRMLTSSVCWQNQRRCRFCFADSCAVIFCTCPWSMKSWMELRWWSMPLITDTSSSAIFGLSFVATLNASAECLWSSWASSWFVRRITSST